MDGGIKAAIWDGLGVFACADIVVWYSCFRRFTCTVQHHQVVKTYLSEQQPNTEEAVVEQPKEDQVGKQAEIKEEEEVDEGSNKKKRKSGDKEFGDDGDLIICRLSKTRRVTITEFRGKTLVSMREYYRKDGKELPTSKGGTKFSSGTCKRHVVLKLATLFR